MMKKYIFLIWFSIIIVVVIEWKLYYKPGIVAEYNVIYTNRAKDSIYKYLDTTITKIVDLSVKIDTNHKKPALILFGKKYIKIISDQKNMQNVNFKRFAQGSGFWINDSILVTARHVVAEGETRNMIVFGDTLVPKILSNYRYDISILVFPKGTADKKYQYKLIPEGYNLIGKNKIIENGYTNSGRYESIIESNAFILTKKVLNDIRLYKRANYPFALDDGYINYLLYPNRAQIINSFGPGTSGGPIILKKNSMVCGVVSGAVQTNDIIFSVNGSVNGIYYLLKKLKNKKARDL